jgi:hypothetical protein
VVRKMLERLAGSLYEMEGQSEKGLMWHCDCEVLGKDLLGLTLVSVYRERRWYLGIWSDCV